MNIILQQPTPIAGEVIRNCASCPFSRPLGGDRYVCIEHCTGSDVVRGHWQPSLDCLSIFAKGGI